MATGLKVGQTVYKSLVGFQWFFIIAVLCTKHKNNLSKRRYEMATLLIARKSGKTFLISIIFALLLLLEPQFSEAYSVAADGELSRIVKKEFEQLLNASPLLSKHFKIKRDDITCKITSSIYKPLNYSNNRMDGRKCSIFLADEVGALPETYAIDAMKSSQINMLNRLGLIISTAYPTINNPMTEEVEYAKKVLDGIVDNETYFSLLYEPDNKKDWKTDDNIIFQSNPLALEIKENLNYLYQQRQEAIDKPSSETNFLTKHLNIFVNGEVGEAYIDFGAWKKCEVDKIDLRGKEVVVSVDASLSIDLTAIDITYEEDGEYYLIAHAFLPENTLPNRREKIDYRQMEKHGYCTITPGDIVDYNLLEDYIRNIEDTYNCRIRTIVTDPYNMLQTMQKLSIDYEVILLKQTYSVLSSPIKSFRDDVYLGKVHYEKNKLLDWCMGNTTTVIGRASGDVLLNKVNKNKSRIDLVVAAVFGYSQLCIEDNTMKITEGYLAMMGW